MKKTLTILTTAAVMLTTLATSALAEDKSYDLTVKVNGAAISSDVKPYIKSSVGQTFVPLRFVGEALGAEITWNAETYTATAKLGKHTVDASIGREYATIDGVGVKIEAAPELTDERTMVPLRVISEGLGVEVKWENTTREVLINLPAPTPAPTQNAWQTWTPDPAKRELADKLFKPMTYDKASKTLTVTIPEFTDGKVRAQYTKGDGTGAVLETGKTYTFKEGEWRYISVRVVKPVEGEPSYLEYYKIFPNAEPVMDHDWSIPADAGVMVIDQREEPATLDAIFAGLSIKK